MDAHIFDSFLCSRTVMLNYAICAFYIMHIAHLVQYCALEMFKICTFEMYNSEMCKICECATYNSEMCTCAIRCELMAWVVEAGAHTWLMKW